MGWRLAGGSPIGFLSLIGSFIGGFFGFGGSFLFAGRAASMSLSDINRLPMKWRRFVAPLSLSIIFILSLYGAGTWRVRGNLRRAQMKSTLPGPHRLR